MEANRLGMGKQLNGRAIAGLLQVGDFGGRSGDWRVCMRVRGGGSGGDI